MSESLLTRRNEYQEPTIYGVMWGGTTDSSWMRTDSAAAFPDPVPYVAGATSYSSPFDNIMPWSGMVVSEDSNAGKVVAIPKFWYKWTRDGATMKLQIANEFLYGFSVSPAHADRGDGAGERDYVYVGRYHCSSSDYKSTTGVNPKVNITRNTARSNISSLGSNVWQFDFAMYWTIAMLYLVEFADWNSQAKIGYGCGNNSSIQSSGASDNMPYHTGTMQSSRTTYAVGCQYRNIEDLWGNVIDWCDGIYFNGANIYCIKNPSDFSDSSNGVFVGTRGTSSNFISSFNTPNSGYEYALYPYSSSGSTTTYVCDYVDYNSSGNTLCIGGPFYQGEYYGLFYFNGRLTSSTTGNDYGSRLMILP